MIKDESTEELKKQKEEHLKKYQEIDIEIRIRQSDEWSKNEKEVRQKFIGNYYSFADLSDLKEGHYYKVVKVIDFVNNGFDVEVDQIEFCIQNNHMGKNYKSINFKKGFQIRAHEIDNLGEQISKPQFMNLTKQIFEFFDSDNSFRHHFNK